MAQVSGVDKLLAQLCTFGTIKTVEQLQTNKQFMKSFEAGSVLKQSDYKKKLGEVALIAALCIDVLTFFVLKLAGVI